MIYYILYNCIYFYYGIMTNDGEWAVGSKVGYITGDMNLTHWSYNNGDDAFDPQSYTLYVFIEESKRNNATLNF